MPVPVSRLIASQLPGIVAAISEGCEAVVVEAQTIVPVDTGELRDSIHTEPVEVSGNIVHGSVVADAEHAGFVEFGTGIRGAASPGAGLGPYSTSWPGMPAQPYMRPATDTARPAIIEAFRRQGFKT